MTTDLRTFISYAREDAGSARLMHTSLQAAGGNPWLDEEALLPGQNWEQEIARAIHESTHFIALISQNSVNKRGYVQKELRKALDILDQIPPSGIFLIPARLDDSETDYPALKPIHRVDMFPTWEKGIEKILRSLGLPVSPPPNDNFGTLGIRQELSEKQVISKMREAVARDHPNNYSTQKYLIDKHMKAWNKLKHYAAPGVPQDVLSAIIGNVRKDHPFSFSTQLYLVEKHVKAWRELNET